MATALPPIQVNQKTVKDNLFSKHDNRHTFQNSGVYFGHGLGKCLTQDGRNQHHSENHISWGSDPHGLAHLSSTYQVGYSKQSVHRRAHTSPTALRVGSTSQDSSTGTGTIQADRALLSKFQTCTKPNFRRFPRKHSLPSDVPTTKPSTDTTNWFFGVTNHEGTKGEGGARVEGAQRGDSRNFTTPLGVLAATQQPFLKHNSWTYSFKK